MQKIRITEFLSQSQKYTVLDVRSPGEYAHAHIPGAYSLPLFSDEERKIVGTAYKQASRQQAIKIGLGYFGGKMQKMLEDVEALLRINTKSTETANTGSPSNAVLVHCWRGGMRSSAVAWLLDLYGFNVYILEGGYKSFRTWALKQFERPYPLNILGGYTGSGKTQVLKELAATSHAIIDLEGIACHKGSAFGALGEAVQPTQEMFENKLAVALYEVHTTLPENKPIWIEDESQRIGLVNLPNHFFKTMRQSALYFLDVPFEERLTYITEEYGKFKKEELVNAIIRIQKRLGSLNAKNAIGYMVENNYRESFRIVLSYYDKYYERGLQSYDLLKHLFFTVPCTHVSAKINTRNLLLKHTT